MGQRLVISVLADSNIIAKIYYHWSAYSISALNEAKNLIEHFYDEKFNSIEDYKLRLIRILEANGGGVDQVQSEINYVKNMFPDDIFSDSPNRSCGLIALSEKGMEDIQSWSEGDLTVNLDDKTIQSSVYYLYDSLDEYINEYMECYDENISIDDISIYHMDNNPETICFNEIEKVMSELQIAIGLCLFEHNGKYFQLIY